MPRPKRKRNVTHPPMMEGFKPFGIPITDLEPVILFFEEYEAIRLLDYIGMTQLEAAREMAVSRPTLTRIYEKARRTIAAAFVEGKAIFIEGGDYHTDEFWYRCEACYKLLISEKEILSCSYCESDKIRPLTDKLFKMDHQKHEEHPGFCICLHCNTKIPHQQGIPCRESTCPQCGKKMVRENSYHHQLYLKKKGIKDENRNPQ
ncbi:MAG: DUF134 domain-containing protein [Bacteroidetes bacterium]|nr:DUF134 domain-containing protein [Bacteroidota bacterium]